MIQCHNYQQEVYNFYSTLFKQSMKKQENSKLEELRKEMKNNKTLIDKIIHQKDTKEQKKERIQMPHWGMPSRQKKIQMKTQILTQNILSQENQQSNSQSIKNWEYSQIKNKIITKFLPSNIYYPPSCSGYDMAYCKFQDTIYIYGGISCSSSLEDGIKQYFYKYFQGKWSQIKPESVYNPIPRYGHTLTAYQKDLILFGGVSEYKQKLKDRCFYTDFSAYSTLKNNWRVVQACGQNIKTRKNHTASIYGRNYILYGGLDESQEVVNQISWVNLQCKNSRWKSFEMEGRFNHKMVVVEPQSGKDFISIFGGRNNNSQIVSTMYFVPLGNHDGELSIKGFVIITHMISPRQLPIMTEFGQGFLILGGINEYSDIIEDCWCYNGEKQVIEQVKLNINFSDLRGARACSIKGEKVYVLAGNSSANYKSIQFICDK